MDKKIISFVLSQFLFHPEHMPLAAYTKPQCLVLRRRPDPVRAARQRKNPAARAGFEFT
jgi:hypothetical protein